MFKITDRKGFHMTFENGYTVSVQFGYGNYCDNRDSRYGEDVEPSRNAEVAAWDADGNWVKLSDYDVVGHQSTTDVLAIMNRVAAMEPNFTEVMLLPAPNES